MTQRPIDALLPQPETPASWVQQKVAGGLQRVGFSNYAAQRQGHRVADALTALSPLGPINLAWQDTQNLMAGRQRDYTGMALAAIPGGPALKAYHAGPKGLNALKPSAGGAVGPGLYVATDALDAAYWGKKLGGNAQVYEVNIPKGPYATKAQFFAEVKKLGATMETMQAVHAQAAKNLAARGFVGVRNGKDVAIFDPENAVQMVQAK